MKNKLKTLRNDRKGFSLTEVMIGMMILTVAIVASTNLLVGLIRSNTNAVSSLQAYYLAQEGIESVRNIRDTNWLHNRSWLSAGSVDLWGARFMVDEDGSIGHDIVLEPEGWIHPPSVRTANSVKIQDIARARPWSIFENSTGKIYKYINSQGSFLSSGIGIAAIDRQDTGFARQVYILPYQDQCRDDECVDFVLVKSVVTWDEGESEVVLETVLTDWKGGAL